MIRVAHVIKKEVIEKEVFRNPSFLLTDKKGGFFSLGANSNETRYNGSVFLKDNLEAQKVIESIGLVGTRTTHLANAFYQIERLSGRAREHFFLEEKALVYDVLHFDGEAQVVLDVRPLYDFDDKGRFYEIYREEDVLVVEYRKENENAPPKKMYLAIKTKSDYKRVQEWKKAVYEYDLRRGSMPAELYVFDALRFRVRFNTRIVFSWDEDKEKAKARARHVMVHADTLKELRKAYWERAAGPDDRIPEPAVRMAYSCAKHSLDSLVNKIPLSGKETTGIFAGLPWFHQFWTRDEAIALKGLILMGRYNLAKEIIMRELSQIKDDGIVQTRYPSQEQDLASADAAGWTFVRLEELMSVLKRKNLLNDYFSEDEMKFVIEKLEQTIVNLIKYHTQQGLAVNRGLETWMDTTSGTDTRVGARIEIQALRLRMYQFMEKLLKMTGNKDDWQMYQHLEHEFQRRVKHVFWNGEFLADGINREIDPTIRPNAFIAGYLTPELLTKNEWVTAVKTMLPKLWCSWGGLTTIDKEDELFQPEYTGEDNRSYHRGDSWFWVNNLTGVFLHRLDKDLFKEFIQAIVKASSEEILFSGFIGHAAELSSASELESHGCWAQAWSAATFIELVEEVYGLG
ncbi:hypothetical protein D6764_05170 [Candidatus Woesearchaeota archaeon]|nr:MAG: hypothetical protein D6764_05170 [Candidatus Woesearchaeota archaeon]